MKNQISYSPEVRERAVRLVSEQQKEYASQWAAIKSIASKIGCTAETLRTWVRRTEVEEFGVACRLRIVNGSRNWNGRIEN
ncbi:transposase [Nitrosomonas sp. Nm84]|nr:transposase [Nitrosomonas sp. Nm84]